MSLFFQEFQEVEDINEVRKVILGVSGVVLLITTSIVLAAYFLGQKLKKRPGNLLLPYLCGSLVVAFHWTLHPSYSIHDSDSEACQLVGILTVANEQLMRCYEASIFYALWKIYKKQGTNSHQEIAQRQRNFKSWRFHILSTSGMIYITVMSFLIEEPGRDYFGLCTFQWVDEEEKGPIMFEGTIYMVFCVYNVFLCCDVWLAAPEQPFIGHLDEEEAREQDEIEHFQKMLKWYFLATTGVGTILAALDFYAAYETSSDYRSDALIIIHDFAVIAQPLLVMILKLDEPLVRNELGLLRDKIKEVCSSLLELVKKFWSFCKCTSKLCCFCWFSNNRTRRNQVHQNLLDVNAI